MNESMESSQRLAPLGRSLIAAGTILLALRGLTLTARMPGLPSFWYANQPTWIAVGILLLVLGWNALWGARRSSPQRWQPTRPGRRFRSATVYVGDGCHLCEEATALLAEYHQWLPPIEQIDIRSNPQLTTEFGTCIPVIALDGKVRFRGKIQEELLRRLIEGTRPENPST